MKIYNLFKNLFLTIALIFYVLPINAEEIKAIEKSNEYNIFTGMFDFSDTGKKSNIIGIQHQNGHTHSPIAAHLYKAPT